MNCQSSNQASQRRRSKTSSRGPRRNLLANETLDELRKASEFAPSGHIEATKPHSLKDSDAVSEAPTTAPPSKENSPVLTYMASEPTDIEEVVLPPAEWPSLRESLSGWDFCSDASDDIDQADQLEKDETAMVGNWCIVTAEIDSSAATSPVPEAFAVPKEGSVKILHDPSFADRLRVGGEVRALPAPGGTVMPAFRVQSLLRRGSKVAESDGDEEDANSSDVASERRDYRAHGWKKQDKTSWSTKHQKKVTEAVARRNARSFRSRGWLDEEEQC